MSFLAGLIPDGLEPREREPAMAGARRELVGFTKGVGG